jgi:hypothetical protein
MKIKDIILEVFLTKAPSKYSGGSQSTTRKISAPYVGGGFKTGPSSIERNAQKRFEKFSNLPSAKEKFDFLYNWNKSDAIGSKNNKLSVKFADVNGKPDRFGLQIDNYNPTTGDITLIDNRNKISYQSNVNSFQYFGRYRGMQQSQIDYIFIAKPKSASTSAMPAYQRGEF